MPPERRNRTVRRIAGFFGPYKVQVAIVLVAILLTSLLGLVNPLLLERAASTRSILEQDFFKLNLYVGLMIAIPIVSGLIGVGQSVPQQHHRPERHAGPARRAVRPSPADAAALLHRDADRRDPEPAGERRRRRPVGRHRHRRLGHQQPRHRHQHDHRDVPARLAADRPVARAPAVLPVPHLPRRQGPPRGQHRDPEVARRHVGRDRGDAQRQRHPPVQDVRPAGQRGRAVPRPEPDASPASRSARRWSAAGSS